MKPVRLDTIRVRGNDLEQMTKTISLIGQAIKEGAEHLPIRNHAAALATTAPPKDYLGQVEAIYNSFVKNWRYVKDPFGSELVTMSPNAVYNLVIGGRPNDPGIGRGRGAGDCDDATIALGSQLLAIGMPVRIAVTAPPGMPSGPYFTHVFAQASIPGVGWLSVDPVPYPVHGVGYTPKNSRIAYFDLDGKLIGYQGNMAGLNNFKGIEQEVIDMYTNPRLPDITRWRDVGLAGTDDEMEPLDWRQFVLKDFGTYAERIGIMSGEGLGLSAEVEYFRAPDGSYIARTPMLEISPDDYAYMQKYRKPYNGMLALGDEGDIYKYDGLGGFFKKIFRKARKKIKKGRKAIGKRAKKLLKKIPGGKYLVKLGSKIWKIANKFVKPLAKFVGKYAAKLAPVAALIPGYGPAIAAGLHTAGKVGKLMTKYGVKLHGKKGKVRKLKFQSDALAKEFQKELAREAKQEQRRQKQSRQKRRSGVRARRASYMPRGRRSTYSTISR